MMVDIEDEINGSLDEMVDHEMVDGRS